MPSIRTILATLAVALLVAALAMTTAYLPAEPHWVYLDYAASGLAAVVIVLVLSRATTEAE